MGLGIPIIGDIIDAVKDLAGEAIVDKDKKRELDVELERLRQAGEQRIHEEVLAQLEVNKTEASNGSIFVAGWRPFVGWVCGVGLAAQAIVLPLLSATLGLEYQLDTELLMLTLGGMLGIGGMRTYEKVRGVSTNDYTDVPSRRPTATGSPEDLLPPIYLRDSRPPEKTPWE